MSLLQKLKNMLGMAPLEEPSPTSETFDDQAATDETKSKPSTSPSTKEKGLPPATTIRSELTRFIVEKLRTYQNESTTGILGLRLYIVCADLAQEELYRVALWAKEVSQFRDHLDRQLADNYISLPTNWQFKFDFCPDKLPHCTYRQGEWGLLTVEKSTAEGPAVMATIHTIDGQTEQAHYVLNPAKKTTYCIGRGRLVESPSGRKRTNDIAFLNEGDPGYDPEQGKPNGYVSRFHATIHYNPSRGQYFLKVDQGGLPVNGNKTKIIHSNDRVERADIANMSYPLDHDDQIELGGVAKLLFSLE